MPVLSAFLSDPADDPETVGRESLPGDQGESPLRDQPPRQLGTLPVVLRGAVRRFADQHDARLPDAVQEGIEVVRGTERMGQLSDVSHIAREVNVRKGHRGRSPPLGPPPDGLSSFNLRDALATASRSTTSSSVTCSKSSYQRPTEPRSPGVDRHT